MASQLPLAMAAAVAAPPAMTFRRVINPDEPAVSTGPIAPRP
jgi:hypothetical protein